MSLIRNACDNDEARTPVSLELGRELANKVTIRAGVAQLASAELFLRSGLKVGLKEFDAGIDRSWCALCASLMRRF